MGPKRCGMDIKIADRFDEPAILRDFLLGLAQPGRWSSRPIKCRVFLLVSMPMV
jgi:hypothetical protein